LAGWGNSVIFPDIIDYLAIHDQSLRASFFRNRPVLAALQNQAAAFSGMIVNLHSKLTQRDHLKMTHLWEIKAHRRAAPI